jgi:hypothetical protein
MWCSFMGKTCYLSLVAVESHYSQPLAAGRMCASVMRHGRRISTFIASIGIFPHSAICPAELFEGVVSRATPNRVYVGLREGRVAFRG